MVKEMNENYQCIELENIPGGSGNVKNVSVVKFKDKRVVDPERIERLGHELLDLLDGDDSEHLLINFENVKFFSSAAVNKLLVLEKRIRARGGKIRLSNLRPEVRDLFSYTKLDTIFKIDEGQAESMQLFDSES
jgi:anti-anti-sigma factor